MSHSHKGDYLEWKNFRDSDVTYKVLFQCSCEVIYSATSPACRFLTRSLPPEIQWGQLQGDFPGKLTKLARKIMDGSHNRQAFRENYPVHAEFTGNCDKLMESAISLKGFLRKAGFNSRNTIVKKSAQFVTHHKRLATKAWWLLWNLEYLQTTVNNPCRKNRWYFISGNSALIWPAVRHDLRVCMRLDPSSRSIHPQAVAECLRNIS